jgi:hypothetical protein
MKLRFDQQSDGTIKKEDIKGASGMASSAILLRPIFFRQG